MLRRKTSIAPGRQPVELPITTCDVVVARLYCEGLSGAVRTRMTAGQVKGSAFAGNANSRGGDRRTDLAKPNPIVTGFQDRAVVVGSSDAPRGDCENGSDGLLVRYPIGVKGGVGR